MSRNSSAKLLRHIFFPHARRVYHSISPLCQRRTVFTPNSYYHVIFRLYSCDKAMKPAILSIVQYHALADSYLSKLEEKLEELQEENEGVDFDFSAGVLTLTLPSKGVYVFNKQPPNKQIWLSSPISGPKRFDYVIYNEGQDNSPDTRYGEWTYMRDGTSLSKLLEKECQINMTNRTSN